MHAIRHPARALAGLAAAAICTHLASCLREAPPRIEDYIGPARRAATTGPAPTTAPATTAPTSAAGAAPPTAGPWKLTVTEAIVSALANNIALRVERINPDIRRTFEQQERAVFDPVVSAQIQADRTKATRYVAGRRDTSAGSGGSGQVGVSQYLPTGTSLDLTAETSMTRDGIADDRDAYSSRVGLTATQAMLRGAGLAVNLASLRQARLDTLHSQYELRGFAELLVAQTEEAYWDAVLARRQIEIYQSSLDLARKQYDDTKERIRIGKLAATELASAESEIALRQEGLINARSSLASARLALLRLLNPPGDAPLSREMDLESLPSISEEPLDDVRQHVDLALRMRPEMNQARLAIQSDDLELVKTRNGLLPKLDLFLTLGKSGYADSFGGSWRQMRGADYDVLVGLSAEYPPLNRDARARNRRATWTRQQAAESLANLAQLVEVDVRGAGIELLRTREQVRATAATRKLQEVKLQVEMAKFDIGKSTNLLVAQAQRDLLSSQISEIQAVVEYLKALVELRRLDGSLLLYRGIQSPGAQPVTMK